MEQSPKHRLAEKKTGASPVDRSKKGTKRSLLTEAKGIPIGLDVDGANRHDVKLFGSTINNIIIDRPKPTKKNPQGMCLVQDMLEMKCKNLENSLDSQCMSDREVRKQKTSEKKLVGKHGDGLLKEHIVGSIGFVDC